MIIKASTAILGSVRKGIAIFMGLFNIYTACFGIIAPGIPDRMSFLAMNLMLALLLWFLGAIMKDSSKWAKAVHVVFATTSTLILVYYYFAYPSIKEREGAWTSFEKIMGLALIVILLYVTFRVFGWPIPALCSFFLLYSYFGPYLPSAVAHRGFNLMQISTKLFLHTDGIFGTTLQCMVQYIFIFIIFSAFLSASGASEFIVDFALSLFGRMRGGPAKAAVVSSALLGTISGSVIANVVGTGTFTIPLMKSTGYSDDYAGAVEATASTGGQIMPPIMGASAFIMAEMLGVPYTSVIKVAIIPAILYFCCVLMQVDLEAKKLGLVAAPTEKLPALKEVLTEGWYQMIPIVVVVFFMCRGTSLNKSAFYAVLTTVAVSWIFGKKEQKLTFKKIIDAIADGTSQGVDSTILCATLGILVGCVMMTGLSSKLASLLVLLAGGRKLLLLILTMIASIIMGMGLPTTGCYILLSVMVCPALVQTGIEPILAHMFVFFYGVMSFVIPPVAVGAYTAAAISKGNPIRTAMIAWRLAIVGFIVPFFFVYCPALALMGTTFEVITAIITSLIGIALLAMALEGISFTLLSVPMRIILGASSLLFIHPGLVTDLMGCAISVVILLMNYYKKRKEQGEIKTA